MNTKSRIASILSSQSLDSSITGLPTFYLSDLALSGNLDFPLPTNVRLGHLVEKVVSELIKSSTNYKVLFENIQIIENKGTIGEIDFIIEEVKTKQVIHLELAYKFYLFDPTLSPDPINNWIGPNRNDSLVQKLAKIKSKQFPLLQHPCAQLALNNIVVDNTTQVLCLLASLFVPFEFKGHFSPSYQKNIQGYYLNFETYVSLDHSAKAYCIPSKKEWGMNPSENDDWTDFAGVEKSISTSMAEKQAPLCWQKEDGSYSAFFIVWW